MPAVPKGRVLIVAGSDSGGGAGIQADIKTVTVLGGYAATAITALTAQDTSGVHGVHHVPADFIARQMDVVLADIGADAVKTGMLGSAAAVEAVVTVLGRTNFSGPIVVDPVMVAKGGARLLDADGQAKLKSLLIPRAALLTPNIPEAVALSGQAIDSIEEMEEAARRLQGLGAQAVLLKGGHLPGPVCVDILATADGMRRFESPRLETLATHGTGCTLASAIAVGLAQGLALDAAVTRARDYLQMAMRLAPGLGAGHGPLGHGFACTFPKKSD